jgi:NADPH:quinone reductase-like Zn-dependent oxidoreductase
VSVLLIEVSGTGGVSLVGLVLARAAGAITVITSSSDEKLKFVKEKYGADHVINYKKTPNWAEEALKVTGGRGVDFVFENGGSGTIKQSLECIAKGGIVALIGFLSRASQEDMPDVAALTLTQGCIVRGVSVGSKQLMEELVNFVVAKKLRMPVDKVFGFSEKDVVDAFALVEKSGQTGKVCISL